MFKRSNSKSSAGKSPLLRPNYVNAAMRSSSPTSKNAALGAKLLPPLSEAHTKILTEMSLTGKVPASTNWEYVRDVVCKPLIEKLLAVSLQCRSDVNLPNGKWIGAGPIPSASDADGANSKNGNDGSAKEGSQVGNGSFTTAPNTPVGASSPTIGKKKDTDSDSDNDNANSGNTTKQTTASSTSAFTTLTDVIPSVLDKADFETENEYIIDQWSSLPGPTFTLQRLAEILLQNRRYHCYSTEYPFGPAAIALGGASADFVGIAGNDSSPVSNNNTAKRRSSTPSRGGNSSSTSDATPMTPRSQGVLRGEKLQAAIRRCVLVASIDL